MTKLEIKYRLEHKALPPRPIRLAVPGWGGDAAMKKASGSEPQPWHCPAFVEGCTHGVELLYQYETECRIVNEGGQIRIEWDHAKEPGGVLSPDEFTISAPFPSQNYLFTTSIDLQAPPGYVLRTQPHPRFYNDITGTVPAALAGQVRSEWWPRTLFTVFKIPPPGGWHVFRKGEPYVQVLFVPDDDYELAKMTPQEEAYRRGLAEGIDVAKSFIGKNIWFSRQGIEFSDHYLVLKRAFDQGGMPAVEHLIRDARSRFESCLPKGRTVPEYLTLAQQYMATGRRMEAKEVLHHVLKLDPRNPEAYGRLGMLEWDLGLPGDAIRTVKQAIALQPRWAPYQNNLGEMLRRLGRYDEAQATFEGSLAVSPNDPEVLSLLGLTMAQRGLVAQGLERCRASVVIAPRAPGAHYMMGMVLAKAGRTDEARSCYETALSIDPGFAPAREAIEKLTTEAPSAEVPLPPGTRPANP